MGISLTQDTHKELHSSQITELPRHHPVITAYLIITYWSQYTHNVLVAYNVLKLNFGVGFPLTPLALIKFGLALKVARRGCTNLQ